MDSVQQPEESICSSYTLGIGPMHYNLKGCHKIFFFLPQWGIVYAHIERDVRCAFVPWIKGETSIHCRHHRLPHHLHVCLKGVPCSFVETTTVTLTCTDH